ncbi:MAG: hypothetical protein E6G96_00845 [Alphaproteobacteria bacterium]|nr:MAG: hypothetical protein E6G96_00845 [Alphaproteobacteria bacterium]
MFGHLVDVADALKRRIEEASRYADLDQLCLSPPCGFAARRPEGGGLMAISRVFARAMVPPAA